MELGSDTQSRVAPYGHACVSCARAKCKCRFGNDHTSCERCRRLNRECKPAPQMRKKKSRADVTNEVARLEQKLNGAISVLKSIGRDNPAVENAIDNLQLEVSEDQTASFGTVVSGSIEYHSEGPRPGRPALPSGTPSSTEPASFPYVLQEDAEPTSNEAEICFQTFCDNYLLHFPFTQFPIGMTARQLRQKKPFFWLCIMAITSTRVHQQLSLSQSLREIAAQKVLVEGQRTIDLLLGLLCYVGWGQYQMHTVQFLTIYTHLCIAMTIDMDLHKPVPKEHIRFVGVKHAIWPLAEAPTDRTMEHRRLALACYFLSSSLATPNGRVESLSWTPYLEQCLSVLEETSTSSPDQVFIHQIRLQRVVEKATVACIQVRDMKHDEGASIINLHIQTLKMQLVEVNNQIPPEFATNETLKLYILNTEVIINEMVKYLPSAGSRTSDTAFDRTSCLFSCLHAVKSWLDVFLDCKTTAYMGFPLSIWKQLGGVFFALCHLTLLNDPAWDTAHVRRTCNSSLLLDRIANNLRQAEAEAGWTYDRPGRENIHARSVKVIATLKAWVESLLEPTNSSHNESIEPTTSVPSQTMIDEQQQPLPPTLDQLPSSSVFPPFEASSLWSPDFWELWDLYSDGHQDLGRL